MDRDRIEILIRQVSALKAALAAARRTDARLTLPFAVTSRQAQQPAREHIVSKFGHTDLQRSGSGPGANASTAQPAWLSTSTRC